MCLLDFVDQKQIPAFIHVSTAYAAGKKIGRCLEQPPGNNRFFNAYEESKAATERILIERARKMDLDVTITEDSVSNGIYHIVNPVQTRIADIVDYIQEQFRLKGIRTCPPQEFQRTPRNLLERLFESYLQAYSPYMKDQRRFSTEMTQPVLKRRGLVCPPFDADMCRRCMAYAAENDWSAAGLT